MKLFFIAATALAFSLFTNLACASCPAENENKYWVTFAAQGMVIDGVSICTSLPMHTKESMLKIKAGIKDQLKLHLATDEAVEIIEVIPLKK